MADSQPGAPLLYRPGPPLSGYVEYFGYWRSGADPVLDRALPRGAATLIVDLSDDQQARPLCGRWHHPAERRLRVSLGSARHVLCVRHRAGYHRSRRPLPAGWRLPVLRCSPARAGRCERRPRRPLGSRRSPAARPPARGSDAALCASRCSRSSCWRGRASRWIDIPASHSRWRPSRTAPRCGSPTRGASPTCPPNASSRRSGTRSG